MRAAERVSYSFTMASIKTKTNQLLSRRETGEDCTYNPALPAVRNALVRNDTHISAMLLHSPVMHGKEQII